MSTCRRCNCDLKTCGCQDGPLTTHSESLTCPSPQICSEFIYTGCIIYNGPELADIDIRPGMTMNQVIQSLALNFTLSPANVCATTDAVILTVTNISKTGMQINWLEVADAINYTLYYSLDGVTWISEVFDSSVLYKVLTNIVCGTTYQIYVTVDYPLGTCSSLTILVPTLDC